MENVKTEQGKKVRANPKMIALVVVAVLIVVGIAGYFYVIPALKYQNAVQLMKQQNYEEAATILNEIGNFKEVGAELQECYYNLGMKSEEEKNPARAYEYYVQAGSYGDAQKKAENVADEIFSIYLDNDDLDLASEWLDKLSEEEQNNATSYLKARELEEAENKAEAIAFYQKLPENYRDADTRKDGLCGDIYAQAVSAEETSLRNAIELYQKLPVDFSDVGEKLEKYEPYLSVLGDYKLKLAVNTDSAFSYRSTDKDIDFTVDGCVRKGSVYLKLPEVLSDGKNSRQVKAAFSGDELNIDYNVKKTGSTDEYAYYLDGVLVLTQDTDITYENSEGTVSGELFSLFTSGWNEWIGGSYYEAWAKDGADYLEAVQRMGLE